MNPMYVQHHDGVEEAPSTAALAVEGSRPAPPSPRAATSFLRKINEEENHSGIIVSMEPKEGDLDRTDEATSAHFNAVVSTPLHGDLDQTDFDARIHLPLLQEEDHNNAIVVSMEPKRGDFNSTDLDARIHLRLLHVENHNSTVVSTEPKHGDFDSTDADTSADFDAWIDLPRDMCRRILDLLGTFDTLTFPLVCRPWADVYAEKRRLQPGGLQPGAPTLLTSPSEGSWDIKDDYQRGLFFIHTIVPREAFLVEVEGLRDRSWIGGKDEWLVTNVRATYYAVELLNPITRACISLPNDLPERSSFDRVQLCRTPTEPVGGYFAIAISDNMLAYAMAGSSHWIILENPSRRWMNYSDAILYGGKIIAICLDGNLWSWDLDQVGASPKLLLRSSINSEVWTQFYLIPAPSVQDNILIVSPYGEDGVVLHEIDIDAKVIQEVPDIGDRALFLGPNCPFFVPVSVPTGDLKKNHVYIAYMFDHDVVAVDLSLKDLPETVSRINFSRPRNFNQTPMWFRPAFP